MVEAERFSFTEMDGSLGAASSLPLGFRFIELTEYLENLLGKKVDVLTPAGIRGIRITHIAQDIKESIVYV